MAQRSTAHVMAQMGNLEPTHNLVANLLTTRAAEEQSDRAPACISLLVSGKNLRPETICGNCACLS
jgi:hypothetical protein